MDGGGEDGKQQPHLVLAHKLFLLSRSDVDDLAKVDLRADVLAAVKSDGIPAPPPFVESASNCGMDLDLICTGCGWCRHGGSVRVVGGGRRAGDGRGAAGRDARQDRRGDPEARREVSRSRRL